RFPRYCLQCRYGNAAMRCHHALYVFQRGGVVTSRMLGGTWRTPSRILHTPG
ncbi:Hypothetical predicted protein, partial [Pelobates cultripes]